MNSSTPILVEVLRGNRIESVHVVDAVVCDPSGSIVEGHGESTRAIFPRSAIKAIQALPLIESGAADAFGFENRHIALACASHGGEEFHVACAHEMLSRCGINTECLECGAHVPLYTGSFKKTFHDDPAPIHNNCSGKHSGFLAFAKHTSLSMTGYIGFDHPVQKEVAAAMEAVTGARHGSQNYGIDGCSIPTWQIPMQNLATGFAKFAANEAQSSKRSQAMQRIKDACFAHPEMVAGTDRICTKVMQALPNKAFVKVGAEGVYTASLPEKAFGVALKARDGNARAAEVALCHILGNLLELDGVQQETLIQLSSPAIKNWNGIEVGKLQVAS